MADSDDTYKELSESINNSYQLMSRIDERMQALIKKQDSLEEKIEERAEFYASTATRLSLIEDKTKTLRIESSRMHEDLSKIKDKLHEIEMHLQTLQISSQGQESKWKVIFNFGLQLAWVLLAAFLLYKLGWQAPGVP